MLTINKIYRLTWIVTILLSLTGCQIPPPPPLPLPPATITPTTAPTPDPELQAACRDYSNQKVVANNANYYWRFHLAFHTVSPKIIGCLQVISTAPTRQVWKTKIPCVVHQAGALLRARKAVLYDIPELPQAPSPLPYIVLQPENYIECDLNLNRELNIGLSEMGISVITQSVYTYSYFSMSALTYLSSSQPYSGIVVSLAPQQCTVADSVVDACNPSTWSVFSSTTDPTDTIRYETHFNGEITPTITASAFPYSSTYIQGWWVGIRTQFDSLVGDSGDTLKEEHLHDQSFPISGGNREFRHETTSAGKKYLIRDAPDRLVKIWGGQNKIYIGGLPGQTFSTFNGAIFQIMIDPSGGGSPDGGI